MRRFRKISVKRFDDPRRRSLTGPQPNPLSLLHCLEVGPFTNCLPGVNRVGVAGLAEALEWPVEACRSAFQELQDAQLVLADFQARVVVVLDALEDNTPHSPKFE